MALWIVAGVVFFAGRGRTINRRLALLLFVAAVELVTGTWSLAARLSRPEEVYANYALHMAAGTALPFLYLWFQARAFDSAPTRWLRQPQVERTLVVGAILSTAVFLLTLPRILPPADYRIVLPQPENTWFPIWASYVAVGFAITLVIASWAFMEARDADERRRLRSYVLAFAVLDGTFILNYTTFALYVSGRSVGSWLFEVNAWTYPAAPLLFAVVLAYAILERQLFDIDLKIKFAVRKSTIIALFAVTFLVANEVVERALGIQAELFGVAAAVALGLVFRRVESIAGRLADRLMPGVEDTDAYRRVRKGEVYRAAFESALRDGEITQRERSVLATLAEQMGLTTGEAQSIEQDAQAAGPP